MFLAERLREQPYLVQRVRRQDPGFRQAKGIDQHFRFDYMGAAEFECGTVNEALRLTRQYTSLPRWEVLRLKFADGGRQLIAWYVGPPEARVTALAFFVDQLGARRWLLKECTFMHECYYPERPQQEWPDFDGWWALDAEPCPWALFRQKPHAEQWLKDLRRKPT